MKKFTAVLLVLMMLFGLSAVASEEQIDLPRVTENNSVLYDNTYLGYSLRVWKYLTPVSDELNQLQLQLIHESSDEDDDYVYDVRYWVLGITDSEYMYFSVQLKDRSCETLEEELEISQDYAAYVNKDLAEDGSQGHYENIQPGVMRDTPVGQMLETSYVYIRPDGGKTNVVYYDFYYNTIEYCFVLECESDLIAFESMQQLLADMMSTIKVQNVLSEV